MDARLLSFASRLVRIFEWPLPDAPGGIFIGGEVDPEDFGLPRVGGDRVSIGAAAATFRNGFQRCVGEGIEYLSQIADGTEAGEALGFRELAGMHGPEAAHGMALLLRQEDALAEASFPCVPATALLDGHQLMVPAELCLRAPEPRLRAAASTGCAAGASYATACLSGLLELVERDAAALWWVAGRPARQVPLEVLAEGRAIRHLLALRAQARNRRTFLFDITSDVAVPVVAAVSFDDRDRGFASGTAAATRIDEAAAAAITELCQLELARHVVRLKLRQRGPPGLNEVDVAHLRRGEAIDLGSCPRFRASGAAPHSGAASGVDVEEQLRWVAARVAAAAGGSPIVVELTRARFGVPVAKILAPGLQLYPADVSSRRLQQARARFGGSLADCGGIGLF